MINSIIDMRIDYGTATNQVLVWDNTDKRFVVTLNPSGLESLSASKLFAITGTVVNATNTSDSGIITGLIGATGSLEVSGSGEGAFIGGYVFNAGDIKATKDGAMARGRVEAGCIEATGIGSSASGSVTLEDGGIFADGIGSIASGSVTEGFILAAQDGSMAIGVAGALDIIADAVSCIQLGVGTNTRANSLQVGDITDSGVQLRANGNITATGSITATGGILTDITLADDICWTGASTLDGQDDIKTLIFKEGVNNTFRIRVPFSGTSRNWIKIDSRTVQASLQFGNDDANPDYEFMGSGTTSLEGNFLIPDGGYIGAIDATQLIQLDGTLDKVTVNGGIIATGTGSFGDSVFIEVPSVGQVPLTLKGASGQTERMFCVLDSNDNVLTEITNTGHFDNIDGMRTVTPQYGAGIGIQEWGENDPVQTGIGWYDHADGALPQLFVKTSGTNFEQANADNSNWIIFVSGDFFGAMAEIKEFISITTVTVSGFGWDQDINSVGDPGAYIVVEHPIAISGYGFKHEFSCGATGEFEVKGYSHTGPYVAMVEFNAAADGADGLLVEADAGGYNAVQSLVVDYNSGALQPGDTGGAVASRLVLSDAVAADATTEVENYLAVIINGTSATSTAFKALPGFVNALEVQGAPAVDPAYGYEDTATVLVDRVNSGGGGDDAFVNSSTNVEIFTNIDDYILIGNDTTFEIIEWTEDTGSSKHILPTFEYSTGNDTWSTLPILADGTAGFQQSGQISFIAPGGWATSNASNGDAITVGYYIRITRNRAAAIVTLPIEDHFKIFGERAQGMKIRGDGTIKPVSMADVDAVNDSIYRSTTGGLNELVYKDQSGTVNQLY